MRKISGKKGSHVEIVISFAIFVTFLVFLYTALEPAVGKPKSKEYILDSLKPRVINYVEGIVESYEITIHEEQGENIGSCFDINDAAIKKNSTAKSNNGIIATYFNPTQNTTSIEFLSDENEIRIYYSEAFSNGEPLGTCRDLVEYSSYNEESYYTKTHLTTERHIFKTKMEKMKEEYETEDGFNRLSTSLNLPRGTNFYFKVANETRGDFIVPERREVEGDLNVYVEEIPITFIDEAQDPEEKQNGFLTLELW
jgi:hypothetical protein